jgi:GxxExxY protein
MKTTILRKDLIYPELSYQIIGILFEVWTKLGFGHKENFYQNAIAQEFTNLDLKFKEKLPVKISYKGKVIGIYYFDFLIEDKVILEVKVRNYFSKKDIEQLYSYLKAKNF